MDVDNQACCEAERRKWLEDYNSFLCKERQLDPELMLTLQEQFLSATRGVADRGPYFTQTLRGIGHPAPGSANDIGKIKDCGPIDPELVSQTPTHYKMDPTSQKMNPSRGLGDFPAVNRASAQFPMTPIVQDTDPSNDTDSPAQGIRNNIGSIQDYDPMWACYAGISRDEILKFKSAMKFQTLICHDVIRVGDEMFLHVDFTKDGLRQRSLAKVTVR